MEFKIKKLGGENAAELHKSAKNIYEDYIVGNFQAVVVSAMRSPSFNTTDILITIGKELAKEKINQEQVKEDIERIKKFHLELLENKIICSKEKLVIIIQKKFLLLEERVGYYMNQKNRKIIPSSQNDYRIEGDESKVFSILGFGEALSCQIFSGVIDSISAEGICSSSVDLSNLVNEEDTKEKCEKEVFKVLSRKIADIIEEKQKGGRVPVLSGYIGVLKGGIEKAIGRGYSDATAAACSVGLAQKGHGVILEIQKSVKGFLSADPRILDNPEDARLITELDYLIAREITGDTGAKARLLHPQALRSEVQEVGVKIHVYNPFSNSDGSWIIDRKLCNLKGENCKGVSFIGGRKNVVFFSVSSGKMFTSGVLVRLFTIVRDFIPVDIVSTSETEITFTIDGNAITKSELEEMRQKIIEEFHFIENTSTEFVEYVTKKGLLFCVGEHMKHHIGMVAKLSYILSQNNIHIEMLSQGRLQRAIVFGIPQKDMEKAINILHKEFIV